MGERQALNHNFHLFRLYFSVLNPRILSIVVFLCFLNFAFVRSAFTQENTLPDLVVISLNVPVSASSYQKIDLTWIVSNQGKEIQTASTPPWYDELYFSTDDQLDETDISLTDSWQHRDLTAGEEYTVTKSVTIPQMTTGVYYLILKTNMWNEIEESNENNNVLAKQITVIESDMEKNEPDPNFISYRSIKVQSNCCNWLMCGICKVGNGLYSRNKGGPGSIFTSATCEKEGLYASKVFYMDEHETYEVVALFSLSGFPKTFECEFIWTIRPALPGDISKGQITTTEISDNDGDSYDTSEDCDDADALEHPNQTWYKDADNDKYSDGTKNTTSCTRPAGYKVASELTATSGDCDETNAALNPATVWYKDADNDGYSDGTTKTQCAQPSGYKLAVNLTATSGDCNDADASINLGATEVCNGKDDNCNGSIDEGVKLTFYKDTDGDTYGDPNNSTQACTAPTGYVTDNMDCDDADALEHPNQTWYKDADNDKYSDGTKNMASCTRPSSYYVASELTSTSGDCNDGDASINPSAAEVCNAKDDNCNGSVDEGVKLTFYKDSDGDTYGDLNNSTQACTAPTGYVTDNTDCDDADALEHPNQTWYKDADNDKYSDGTKNTASCTRPSGYKVASELTATSGDCDETNAALNPATVWYKDADNDGYSDGTTKTQCAQPSGYKLAVNLTATSGDCNDADASINLGATEVCNGKDDNCNGEIDEGVCFISCTDEGIKCVERICDTSDESMNCNNPKNLDDNNNLVDDKPRCDVKYEFRVDVKDTGGTPEYVKLFMTQRNNPPSGDFFDYTMTCSGDYSTGATCTYTTKLGPAAIHKFYIETKFSNGATKTYPENGHITGPQVQLLTGYNLIGVPRDINSANLNGSQAFGSSTTYRWDASDGYYKLVTNANPVKTGEGYFSLRKNNTLYELINYGDIQANEHTYQLNANWNIISNPYGGNVRLSDIKVQKGSGTPVTWQEAISAPNGWIANAIYYYKGTDWGDTYDCETTPDAILVPWIGYWVKLNYG